MAAVRVLMAAVRVLMAAVRVLMAAVPGSVRGPRTGDLEVALMFPSVA